MDSNAPLLLVSSSPHAHSGSSVRSLMVDVIVALLPATLASVWFFGWNALRLVAVCTLAATACEWICRKIMRRENTLGDCSALLTGLLLALNLPPSLPTWMAIAGSIFAIAIAKQVFGGLGYNPFNPALAGRVFLLISFTGAMTTWTPSPWLSADALTTATPLGCAKAAIKAGQSIPFAFTPDQFQSFLLGNTNGSLGETSALALLLGAGYLLYRRVISWHVPVCYLGTVAVGAGVLRVLLPETSLPVACHLLSGGLILGACFMATDMVTSPLTRWGLAIFGIGCGLLTLLIRCVPSGAYPEGVSFAILVMNAFVPLINRVTRHQIFGTRPRGARP
ncbi:MAG: RnfABCDGE type electron transport complex subunit D [Kiritimatiellia bacterium]